MTVALHAECSVDYGLHQQIYRYWEIASVQSYQ